MRRLTMLAVLALAGCSGEPKAASVQALDPWCRPSAAGAYTAACYVTLTADSDETLVSASSPLAARVEIHATDIDAQGVARMTLREDGLALPKNRAVAFKAGADHLMLIDPARALADGDSVPLALTFRNAPPMTVQAQVRLPVS